MRRIDERGHQYGRLRVLSESNPNRRREITWVCRCDCGVVCCVSGRLLREGRTHSCGCLRRERTSAMGQKWRKHGHSLDRKGNPTPTYNSWQGMKQRCLDANAANYDLYGGRGITICSRWLGPQGFQNFLADLGERPAGTSLDRINSDGHYTPENTRWATAKEQGRNRRTTKLNVSKVREIRRLVASGQTQVEVAKKFDVEKSTIHQIVHHLRWRNAA
jgi:hypothetical protein